MNNELYDMIFDISKEFGLKCSLLSGGWIIKLSKGDKTRFIAGYKFDLNNHALGLVLDDKYALYETLRDLDIKVIEHNLVYGIGNKNLYAKDYNNFEYVKGLFHRYGDNVVLKINNGTCGNNVEHITNINDLEKTYMKLGVNDNSLSLCPYYEIINEYRTILLDGEVVLVYKKEKPQVIGDGVKTIKELLLEFNYHYFKKVNKEGLDIVLDKDEVYVYDWRFNLSKGARLSENIDDIDRDNVLSLVKKVISNLDIGFGSIDVIKTKDDYYVLEINSGVMMKNFINEVSNGKERAYGIYKEAVKKMFDIK